MTDFTVPILGPLAWIDVVLLGWVHRVRDLGGLLFIDVRDRNGVTQIVFDKDDEALMNKAKRLRSEPMLISSGRTARPVALSLVET